MTITNEELLKCSPQSIRIECQAEERHFPNAIPTKINATIKPIRFHVEEQLPPGRFRSEILVENNPNVDFYIKRLRVGFHVPDDASKQPRSQSLNARIEPKATRSTRSTSVPRTTTTTSQTALHQWIDEICSNEKLMIDDDICFFIKNGEFLARI